MFVFSFNSVSSAREISDFSKPATVFEMPPPWPDLVHSGAAAVGRISALLRKVLSMSDPTLAAGSSALVCVVTSLACSSVNVVPRLCVPPHAPSPPPPSSSLASPSTPASRRHVTVVMHVHRAVHAGAGCFGCTVFAFRRTSHVAFLLLLLFYFIYFLLRWVGGLCGYSPGCLRVCV